MGRGGAHYASGRYAYFHYVYCRGFGCTFELHGLSFVSVFAFTSGKVVTPVDGRITFTLPT